MKGKLTFSYDRKATRVYVGTSAFGEAFDERFALIALTRIDNGKIEDDNDS